MPRGGPGTDDPEHYTWGNMSLRALVQGAYGMNTRQVMTPGMTTTRFDLSAGATKQDFRQMERTLLDERFHLRWHYEDRPYKVYSLVVAKGGLKVQPPSSERFPPKEGFYAYDPNRPKKVNDGKAFWLAQPIPGGGWDLQGATLTMSDFTGLVEVRMDVNVFNKTGIDGFYDLKMRVASNEVNALNLNALPTMFDALAALGLRLEPGTANLPTLLVDSADKVPTEN
jgi:uncharacterized protein (TIGR03435 family)